MTNMEQSIDIENKAYKINTKFIDDFSKEIYEQTYKYGDEDINKTQLRVAKDLASIEKDPEYWTQEFLWALEDFKFVPGGRITSNAGTKLKGTTYVNCFTPDVNILTNNGYKRITDIEIGDMVLTHKGRFKPVVSLMKTPHNGEVISFKSGFITDNIKSTLNHPFYVGKNKWVDAELISDIYLLKYEDKKDTEINIIDLYKYVSEVKRKSNSKKSIISIDDYLYSTSEFVNSNGSNITTRNKSKTKRYVDLNEDFAYFIGRYIGDGSVFSVNHEYDVDGFNIAFSKKEIDSQLRLKNIIEKSFEIEVNINNSNQFEGSYLRKSNIVVSNFLKNSCGRYSDCKKIPDFIWNANIDIRRSFINGLFDADGTITNKEVKIVLNNEFLINDLQALLLSCNIPSNFKVEYVNNKSYYKLAPVRQYMSELIKKSEKVYADDRIYEYSKLNNDENEGWFKSYVTLSYNEIDNNIFSISPTIEKEKYNGYVYNISVLDDESYVVNNAIVHNCFVDGFMGQDQDSMEGILDALRRQALILKSEGGYGFCADVMRPRGSFIRGIGNESPGSVKMLDMWDTQSAVITEGSGNKTKNEKGKVKIRKGAQMVTMSVFHPDIEEFITAKQTPGKLTKFNMSVLITDDFMDAVKNKLPWSLEFPDYESHSTEYKLLWDGNLKKWKEGGLKTTVFKTFEDANELWDIIMSSTYNRNEPGVLFSDTMNRLNNLNYCEYINSTNPCVVGNTLVLTNIGWIKISKLENYKNIKIITRDKDDILCESELKWSGITKKDDDIIRVDFSNDEYILCNKKHKLYRADFSEISMGDVLESNIKENIIGGDGKILSIEKVTELDYKEDVYDLTAVPNYNFFTLLNNEEKIIEEKIIINDNIELNYFSIVDTANRGKIFAFQLEENDNII